MSPPSSLTASFSSGKVLHQKIDKAEVASELRRQLSQPVEPETAATRQMARQLAPYVEQYYRSLYPATGMPPVGVPHYSYNSRT